MVGEDKKDESFKEFLDPLVREDAKGEEWGWEEEAKHQKIRKRKVPVGEEGTLRKKERGGPFRKKR